MLRRHIDSNAVQCKSNFWFLYRMQHWAEMGSEASLSEFQCQFQIIQADMLWLAKFVEWETSLKLQVNLLMA